MAIGFLCNVGNRDLYVDGRPVDLDCRRRGEEILQQYDQYRGRLTAPIIEAGLGYILRQHPQGLDWLVPFVTDQDPETTKPEHYARDTVNIGQMLKCYLTERYRHAERAPGILSGKGKGVVCHRISGNPTYYDEMYSFYGEELRRPYFQGLERCYVSPVGGIPAANMALLLQAVATYGEKCHAIYVPEGSHTPTPMNITERILKDTKRRLAKEYLDHCYFAQAAGLMGEADAPSWLVELARCAAQRLNMDYQGAWETLNISVLPHTTGRERHFVRKLCEELGQIGEGGPLPAPIAIGELYWGARIAYESGRYMDFLHRVFSFLETALPYLVKRGLGIPVPSSLDSQEDFVKAIEANPYLQSFLGRCTHGSEPLHWREKVARPVLIAMVRYLGEDGRGPDGMPLVDEVSHHLYAQLAELFDRLEPLAALRNRCVHPPFQGVSQQDILEHYRQSPSDTADPLQDMAKALRLMELRPEDDPYRRLAKFIAERL